MRKRGFSIFLRAIIGVLFVFGSLSSVYADSNVVYSLANDTDLQSQALGYTFEGTTWLLRSGDPALTLYDAGGTKGIKILGRDQDWDCIDLRNLDTLPEGADYTIKVTGSASAGAKMKLSQGKSPWGTHLALDVGSDGAYVLEKTFTYEELQKEKAVRIQTEGTTGDFSIASIEVIKVGGQTTVAYTLAKDADLQTKAVGFSFENTTWLQRSGDPALTLFDVGGVKGIAITGRDQDWDCIDLRNLDSLPEGFTYTIKATGNAAAGSKMKLSQGKSPWGTHISLDVGSNGAYALEKTFTYEELQKEKTVRIQTEGTTGDFSIKSIEVLQTAAEQKAAKPVLAYSLATDKDILETSAGTAFEGSTWLQQSGSPAMKVVENADGLKYLRLTGRKQDWDCVDLKNLTSLAPGFDYTIKVTGRSFEGIKMKLSQPASPWGTHISQAVGEDGRFALEKTFTYDELQKEKAVRIQSEGSTSFFSVEGIDIIQIAAAVKKAAAAAPKAVVAEGPKAVADGVFVWDNSKGDSWSGANIILGKDASQWPWAAADSDGKLAFTPVKNASYRLTINYTARGTSAIRIRWIKDNTNGSYTKGDAAVVNSYQYAPSDVSVTIPAYFNKDMANGESYTLVTEIKLDGAEAADGLIGNIAIRGGAGGNDFTINSIKIEQIGSGADKLLVKWPK